MTKNALTLFAVVFLLCSLNIFTNILGTVAAPTDKPDANDPPGTNSQLASSCHHYYHNIDNSDGGKSIAFLRLGRSSEETEDKDEGAIKEVDETTKSTVPHKKHNITKRSNSPQDVDESLTVGSLDLSDDQNKGEWRPSEMPESLVSSSSYDPNEVDNKEEEELDENEQASLAPYEDSDMSSMKAELEDDDIFDIETMFPYSSTIAKLLNKRNSFSLRPMKRNNFAFRPMKKNNFAFRPMKRNNFAFRPMKKSNFEFRPMKRNNFAFRPMKRNNFAFRPMKRNGDSFAFRPVKKRGNNFALRPMKRGTAISKDSFLRYGKRDSFALRPMKKQNTFALRPMKRPEVSFVLRPMKRGRSNFLGSVIDNTSRPKILEKRNSFSLRPMKKDTIGFQLRPMKRDHENYEMLKSWEDGTPYGYHSNSIEEYNGIDALFKR